MCGHPGSPLLFAVRTDVHLGSEFTKPPRGYYPFPPRQSSLMIFRSGGRSFWTVLCTIQRDMHSPFRKDLPHVLVRSHRSRQSPPGSAVGGADAPRDAGRIRGATTLFGRGEI